MHPQDVLELLRAHALADPTKLEGIQSKAEYYDSELTSWQQRLDAALILVNLLQTKVNDLERKRGIYTSYIAPIQSLPAELLSRIFVVACEDDPDFDIFPTGRLTGFLTSHALVRVCKFWRTVALDTRGIWRHSVNLKPRLQIASDITDRLQGVTELYGQNMARLYVHLGSGYAWPGLDRVRDIILPIQNHLKTLTLVGNVFEGLQPVTFTTPLLEELLLSADVSNYELGPCVTFDSPKLTHLFLYYPPSALSLLSIPWRQITYLSFGFPIFRYSPPVTDLTWFPLETVLDFLQHISSLIHLNFTCINISYPVGGDPAILKPVTLPRLRTLELSDLFLRTASVMRAAIPPPVHQWESLVTYLSTPALERFDWIIPETVNNALLYSIPSINHFLRTTPRIQVIRIAVCDFGPLAPSAVQRTHIIRIRGTFRDFSTLRSLGDEGMLKAAAQRRYPAFVSPAMVVKEGVFSPVQPQHCNYIDNFLEGEEPDAYGPVEVDFPAPPHSQQVISRLMFEGFLGAEIGPVGCERQLYLIM